MTPLPTPTRQAIDQRSLNGEGPGAWRDELWVASTRRARRYTWNPSASRGDRCTPPEVIQERGGCVLAVDRHTGSPRFTDTQRGEMTGEVAEAWGCGPVRRPHATRPDSMVRLPELARVDRS